MKIIDKEKWARRELFTFFSRASNPFYMVTFQVDVTNVYAFAKANGCSFYTTMVGLCTLAVNDVEAFRMAIKGEDVVVLDRRHPSFTDLHPNSEAFHIVTLKMDDDDLVGFARRASALSQTQDTFIHSELETDDLIYFSCLPWVELTALTNERDMTAPNALDDSIPRIVWGKYVERDGRKMLGLSMEVNHRFIDGLHIGRFAQALEGRIEGLI